MKKVSTFFFLLIATLLPIAAQNSNDKSESKPVILETGPVHRDIEPGRHRTPLHIDISAFYDATQQTLTITYNGESEGEVYLYKDAEVIDYSTEINTSFSVTIPGSYKIEIQTESWTAEGYLEL